MSKNRLDDYLKAYTSFNDWLIERRYQYLARYFCGKSCLEMGSAEGQGTKHLLEHFKELTVVDGSRKALERIRKELNSPKLSLVHAYFEDMEFTEKFDTIIMGHVLEHVDSPLKVLRQAKKYLHSNGVMIIDVPNGNSLHRQIGVKMGLLKEKTDLNEADLSIGHQRVYTPETFKQEILKSGLIIQRFGGMFIKVLSNAQTEKILNEEQREAFFLVGTDNPDIAAEIYAVANVE